MKDINVAEIIKKAKASEFCLGCSMPIGYVPGYPIVSIVAGKPCLKVPFLKYKITGEVDKTLVYPVKYVLTYALPSMKAVGFEDLEYNSVFKKVDFSKPIGFFRHDEIKSLSKKEYKEKKDELFAMYDDFANAILNKKAFTKAGEFKKLLGIMLEPSVKPIYKALDEKFYDNFLA